MKNKLSFLFISGLLLTSINSFSQYFCLQIIEPQFDELSQFNKGYAAAKLDGKWGFIDLSGEFIISPSFDETNMYEFNGFPTKIAISGKKGVVEKNGNYLVKPEYDEIIINECSLYSVKSKNKWFFLDKNGNTIIDLKFDSIDYGFEYGNSFNKVWHGNKCGLLDTTGNLATQIIYEEIYEFNGDISAQYGQKWGLLNKNGTWAIKPELTMLYEFYDNLAIAKYSDKWGLIRKDGTWKVKCEYDALYFTGENFIIAEYNGSAGILDTSGNWLTKPDFDYISNYTNTKFVANKDNKYGIIDKNGNWLCEFMYPYATHYSHDLFKYDNQGDYGLMNASGNILRDYEFDHISYMYEEIASFTENGKYGLIDSLGEIIFEAQADEEIEPWGEYLPVVVDGYSGLISRKGTYILEPKFSYITARPESGVILYTSTYESEGEILPYYNIIDTSGNYIYGSDKYIHDYFRGYIITYDNFGELVVINPAVNYFSQDTYDGIYRNTDSIITVSKASKYGALMISDAQTLARLYVENKTNFWQKKGEFEKVTDYQKRVTEASRSEQAKVFYDEVETEFISQLIDIYDWNNYQLSPYDAENESFLIKFPELGNIVLKVPVKDAQEFKTFKDSFYPTNQNIHFDGKNFTILSIIFENYDTGKSHEYDATNSPDYAYSSLNYNFKPLDFNYQTNVNIVNNYQKPLNLTDIVDIDIPLTNKQAENTFAVIIGNENYKNEQKVVFAENDARIFKEYLVKTMGIPENRVHLLMNATLGEMLGEIEWLKNTAKAYDGDAKIIFYYAGHGMPEAETNEAYLLPCDGSSSNSRTGIKLSVLYDELSMYPTTSSLVLLDACFSGAARDGMLVNGRGTRIQPKENMVKGNMLVLSAASGSQIANPYDEKSHGLFTYFLLAKLRDSKGDVSYGELAEYIKTNVKRTAIEKNKEQEPSFICTEDLKEVILKTNFLR